MLPLLTKKRRLEGIGGEKRLTISCKMSVIESNDSVRFCLKNGLELRESIERTVR